MTSGSDASLAICASISVAMGEHDHAIAAGQRALALATTSGAFDVQVIAQTYLGTAYYARGGLSAGAGLLAAGDGVAHRRLLYELWPGRPPAVTSRGYVAWCLAELGDFAEGRGVGRGMRLAEAAEQPYSIAGALMAVGLLSRRQGSAPHGDPHARTGPDALPERQHPAFLPRVASILGAAYALAGRVAEARRSWTRCWSALLPGAACSYHALVLTELSEALLLVGRVDEASTLAERLLDLSRTHKGAATRHMRTVSWATLPRIASRRTSPRPKPTTARPSLWPRSLACVRCRRTATAALARCMPGWVSRSRRAPALSAAIDLYRAMEMTFWLPQAEAALARVA